MTELQQMMSVAEAETITEYVRAAVEAADRYADLPEILLRAREGRAWQALGYGSWREWGMEACGLSKSRIYQLAAYGKALRELATSENSTHVEKPEAARPATPSEYETRTSKQSATKPPPPVVDVESKASPAADPATGEVADAPPWASHLAESIVAATQLPLWLDEMWSLIRAESDDPDAWAHDALAAALEDVSLSEYRNRQEVSRLRAQGMSLRQIEAATRIPQTTVRRLGARAEGRTEPRASEDVKPSDCKHPVGQRLGGVCMVCGATVASKR